MADEKMAAPVEAVEAVEASAEQVVKPTGGQIEITAQDLTYLYSVLLNSNVPSRDAAFVVQLQQKLEKVLNIQGGR